MSQSVRIRALTLIEIVVVMAIIVALAALIYPVFARAKESSRRTVCKSNLRQIGIAVSLYRQDYDGMEAQKGATLSHSQLGLPHSWSISTFYDDYVKNRSLLFCPSYVPDGQHLGSSYMWPLFESEYTRPDENWEGIAALRGEDYPVVICGSHNGPDIPLNMRASEEVLYYHVLRIDGRVEVRKTTVDERLYLRTW
jgi:prepilin-type N-terminal cleavage/methylation domain-containing protein